MDGWLVGWMLDGWLNGPHIWDVMAADSLVFGTGALELT